MICLGLGYPTLNRYDPGQLVPDAAQYHKMTVGGISAGNHNFAHRLLVPSLAHLVYLAAKGRIGTWDAGYFALLIVNSLFVSGVATMLFSVSTMLFPAVPGLGVFAAMLYLINFAVPNLFLAGLVDSAEAFFLMAVVISLLKDYWWLIPFCVFFGALAKETGAAFAVVFVLAWLWQKRPVSNSFFVWTTLTLVAAGLLALAIGFGVTSTSLFTFASDNQAAEPKILVAICALTHRSLWYAFGYLVPLAMVSARAMPRQWKTAVVSTSMLAFALDVYRNDAMDAGPDLIRPIFSIAAPLLSLFAAYSITTLLSSERPPRLI
jgi:hypothetical protein